MADLELEYHGITPHLTVSDAAGAVAFYSEAFGADELLRNAGPDGRIFHCELLLNDGRLLLHDDFSDHGETPESLGGSPVVLHLYVDDVDDAYQRAIEAGAHSLSEPEDAFWGDRYAQLEDPYGQRWSLGTRTEDISIATHQQRADRWSATHEDLR